MKSLVCAAFALVVLAAPLRAEPAAAEDCNAANSTAEIMQCLATQTAVWDRRLKTAYQKLLETLPPRRRERLRNAQRLWLQFRDANCAYFGSRAGTIARVEAGQCMLRLTSARAQELEDQT
jgi:uncharacterized protein YecT (DUF1311 family)